MKISLLLPPSYSRTEVSKRQPPPQTQRRYILVLPVLPNNEELTVISVNDLAIHEGGPCRGLNPNQGPN